MSSSQLSPALLNIYGNVWQINVTHLPIYSKAENGTAVRGDYLFSTTRGAEIPRIYANSWEKQLKHRTASANICLSTFQMFCLKAFVWSHLQSTATGRVPSFRGFLCPEGLFNPWLGATAAPQEWILVLVLLLVQAGRGGSGAWAPPQFRVQIQLRWLQMEVEFSKHPCVCVPVSHQLLGFDGKDSGTKILFLGLIVVLHPLCWIHPAPNPCRDFLYPVRPTLRVQPCPCLHSSRDCIEMTETHRLYSSSVFIPGWKQWLDGALAGRFIGLEIFIESDGCGRKKYQLHNSELFSLAPVFPILSMGICEACQDFSQDAESMWMPPQLSACLYCANLCKCAACRIPVNSLCWGIRSLLSIRAVFNR